MVDYVAAAKNLIDFIDSSPSPFHAVQSGIVKLEAAGFSKLHETDSWIGTVKRGGKYYLTRNHSSLIAFVVPNDYKIGNGFNIVGAHTDSPCLHVINSKKLNLFNFIKTNFYFPGKSKIQTIKRRI